jgi:diguanylate cyclase (GGDEF)-like protein
MSKRAWAYVTSIIFVGICLYLATGVKFFAHGLPDLSTWIIFIFMTVLMTAAQMFKTEAPTHQIYHPNLMFALAGVLSLPPFLFTNMILVSHLGEWAKERLSKSQHLKVWYLQPFNISMHIFIGLLVQWLFLYPGQRTILSGDLGFVWSALGISVVYVFLNHWLVGFALLLARGVSWKDSGILEFESLLIDFAMLVMGIPLFVMLNQNLWLSIPAMAPLYLIYRALAVPNLKKQANTDSKTGLWNSEYFQKTLQGEMNRAIRFNRPMVLIMADLDLLRNINNVYGHLGGDAVLTGVAEILRKNFREFDTVSRFGGEEFSVLMPETTPSQAFEKVEVIRKQIADTVFLSPMNKQRIRTTMSFGVTEVLSSDISPQDVIHRADMAVYTAKMKGRNRTCLLRQPLNAGVHSSQGLFRAGDELGSWFSHDS